MRIRRAAKPGWVKQPAGAQAADRASEWLKATFGMELHWMCWVLYLAADRPLRLRAFDPGAPAFNVTDLAGREIAVRGQFSKPFVYSLGAHTSCGCGFDRDQANPDHAGELEASEASLRALHAYLGEALELAGPVELFACWDGDQAAKPDHRRTYRLADFGADMAWFPDRTFIEVTPGAT